MARKTQSKNKYGAPDQIILASGCKDPSESEFSGARACWPDLDTYKDDVGLDSEEIDGDIVAIYKLAGYKRIQSGKDILVDA